MLQSFLKFDVDKTGKVSFEIDRLTYSSWLWDLVAFLLSISLIGHTLDVSAEPSQPQARHVTFCRILLNGFYSFLCKTGWENFVFHLRKIALCDHFLYTHYLTTYFVRLM